jgi:hypothetical protein
MVRKELDMCKKTLIFGCVLCFVLGFFVVYIGQTPLNPDVRATVNALSIGMDKQEAIPIMRMSFVLTESKEAVSKENANSGTQVVSVVTGVMPGRAYRYFIRAGFAQNGKLVKLDYCSKKGWLWPFHYSLTPHDWPGNQSESGHMKPEQEP